ncbi:MAG: hypothetical protein ABJG88_11220 [Litorimonas sp.]
MTQKIAFLVSDNLLPDLDGVKRDDVFEFVEELSALRPVFADLGMTLDVVRWRDISQTAHEYDAVLPLMVWDYFEGNELEFMQAMAKVEAQTLLLNSFNVLQWNANKSYLDELEARGASVIPTITVERVTPSNVAGAFETLGVDKIVIKPQVGGGAWRQVLHNKGEPFPPKSELPPQAALIQAFLPSVQKEGEYSFLYFGGRFSHAALKQAKAGEYRIQSIYGGQETPYIPNREERDTARTVLNVLDFIPLYARVDLLRGTCGGLKLIELEMIEPYLYLPHAQTIDGVNQGALALAKALKARLLAT